MPQSNFRIALELPIFLPPPKKHLDATNLPPLFGIQACHVPFPCQAGLSTHCETSETRVNQANCLLFVVVLELVVLFRTTLWGTCRKQWNIDWQISRILQLPVDDE